MSYLIDGHNLIPKTPGMNLGAIDDEDRLVAALQVFCRVRRQAVEVFFDQAPPARAGRTKQGMVVIHSVRQGKTADQAILERLQQLEKAARNWTVVTSDRQVRAGAHECGAHLLTSEAFAAQLQAAQSEVQVAKKENPPASTPGEIEAWLRIFGEDVPAPPPPRRRARKNNKQNHG